MITSKLGMSSWATVMGLPADGGGLGGGEPGAVTWCHGAWQAAKNVIANIPFSCQSSSCSPFLDTSLFIYDEALMAPTHR